MNNKEIAHDNALLSRLLYQEKMELEDKWSDLELSRLALQNWNNRLKEREKKLESRMQYLANKEATTLIKKAQLTQIGSINIHNYGDKGKTGTDIQA